MKFLQYLVLGTLFMLLPRNENIYPVSRRKCSRTARYMSQSKSMQLDRGFYRGAGASPGIRVNDNKTHRGGGGSPRCRRILFIWATACKMDLLQSSAANPGDWENIIPYDQWLPNKRLIRFLFNKNTQMKANYIIIIIIIITLTT